MTIDSQIYSQLFNLNPSGTYIFTFESLGEDTIEVYWIDGDENATFVPTGEHTIVMGGILPIYSGGQVDIASSPPAGTVQVEVLRNTPVTQLVDLEPYTPFPAETMEFALDKLTLIQQEQGKGDATGGGGGGGPVTGMYVPLGGTATDQPITGGLEYEVGTDSYLVSIAFGGYSVSSLSTNGTEYFGLNMNGKITQYTSDGEWLVETDYARVGIDPTATLATMQYVLDTVGGPAADFIPLSGTEPAKPVTGKVAFDYNGYQFNIRVLDEADPSIYQGLIIESDPLSVAGSNINFISDNSFAHIISGNRFLSPGITLYDETEILPSYDMVVTTYLGVSGLIISPDTNNSAFSIWSKSAAGIDYGLVGQVDGSLTWESPTPGEAVSFSVGDDGIIYGGIINTPNINSDVGVFGALPQQAGFELTVNGDAYVSGLLSVTNGGGNATVLANIGGFDKITVNDNPTAGTGVGNRTYNDGRYLREEQDEVITGQWQFNSPSFFNSTIAYAGIPSFAGTNIVLNGFGVISLDTCDMRLKENVVELEYGLAEVLAADIIRFDWKHDFNADGTQRAGIGFNAQQLQDLIPEGSPYNVETDSYGIAATPLLATLYKAVQELSAKVAELEGRLP